MAEKAHGDGGMRWRVRGRTLDLRSEAQVMGVVNVTPDSFSDGGQFFAPEAAITHGLEMAAEGAAILDIGGESTRPGAEPVDAAEQIRRVVPVIRGLAAKCDAVLSVDTTLAAVAEAALAAGAHVVNDISGLRADPAMPAVARRWDAGVVIMHMQGEPRTMQKAPKYDDVVAEVAAFFAERWDFCRASGIADDRVVFDPGIGFGKTLGHNLALLRHLDRLAPDGRPLMLGVSRKSFIGKIVGSTALEDRFWSTVALTSLGRERGCRIFRVHDVRPNVEAMKMTQAILSGGA